MSDHFKPPSALVEVDSFNSTGTASPPMTTTSPADGGLTTPEDAALAFFETKISLQWSSGAVHSRKIWSDENVTDLAALLKARDASIRAAAVEDCAVVAESWRDGNPFAIAGVDWTAGKIGAAIRSLK